jgi:PAS domain S-box-containing protein
MKLSNIIDAKAIQSLMNDFNKLVHIPMGLNDLKGNVLVSAGWQEICTKFHRVNPEACKHCVESDINLSTGVAPGEYKLYKCKNNMWDVVTPIMVEGLHIGNIYSGQFFFEDEPLDYELFRSQAKKYGFNEKKYIAALEKVPRLSREAVNIGMSFLMTFANMVSQLSYSNIKLAKSLAERDALVDALEENKKDFDRAQAVGNIGSWRLDVCKNELTWSDENHRIFGIPKGTPLTYETFLSTVHPDDIKYVDEEWKVGLAGEPYDLEHRIIANGKVRWVREKAYIEFDKNGVLIGGFGITQDITDRKDTEEMLAFERSQLLSIFDGMDDAVYVTDPYTYEVLYANKAMKERSGGELVGGICYREFQDRDSPCDFCTNPIILKERDKPYHWEYYNPTVDRHFMIMDRIIKWPDGRDVRFEIAKDITERKRAEQALKEAYDTLEEKITERTVELQEAYNSLKESEERLADAQKIAHIGSYDWDITTNEEFWSDELYHIFRLDPNLELNHNKFLNRIHPDDLDYVNSAITEAINRKPYDITYRVILPGGEERVIYSQGGVIFDEKNKPIRMRGIVQDITELKKAEEKLRDSEEKYRNIVETANEIILITNNKEVITFVNKKIEDMLGYSMGEVISKPIWSFISKDYRPIVKQHLEKRRQGISESYEAKLIRKDGSTVWVLLNAKPLFDKENKYVGAMSMLTDITQRKEAGEALAKIETARKKEIHHRIKNNLQVISSLLDLQAEKFKNIGYIKDLEVLEAFRESQDRVRSMSLIHEELYKGEGVDIFDFSSYIKELTKNLFLTYRLGNANISLNLDLEENLFFDMDIATPLGLIINELVSNSLKHAFTGRYKGEIQIKLFHEKTEDYTNSIEGNKSEGCKSTNFFLIVSDNGVGIPENVDIKNTYTLGLQLVSSLVDQLDGKLELKRNKGTEFTIRFTVKGKII